MGVGGVLSQQAPQGPALLQYFLSDCLGHGHGVAH